MQLQETRHFLDAIESGRVGRIIGPDLQERLARTFHVNFGSVRIGGEGESSPKGAIDYAFRQGEYGPPKDPEKDEAARERAKKAAELEYTAGDPEEVHRAADLIETSAAVRTGPRAERVLVKQVVELPADTDEEERAEAADALVADWKWRGHPAVAAVHCNGLVQPHVHVLAAARPVSAAGTVDRSVRLWTSKQEVRDERHEVARIVNAACKQRVLFNGGRHEDVGIDREPRRSIPRGVRIGEGRTEPDLEKVAEVREMHEKARAEREREIREKPLRNAEKAVERAVASGAAAQERMDELKAARAGSLDEDLVRVPDPIQPTERQRGAMEDALDRGGIGDADLDAALDQALAFAFLRIERARAREKEVRKRLAELEGGGAQAEEEFEAGRDTSVSQPDLEDTIPEARTAGDEEAVKGAKAESWRPRLAGPVEVANALAALDSAPELDEAMRARRRDGLASVEDGLVDDDPAAAADAAYLDVPRDPAAIELIRKTPGVQYDTGRGLHWIKAGHENAAALIDHFGEVHPRRREREGVTYLSVPGAERDLAVEAGALYDRAARRFTVPEGADPAPFAAWTGLAAEAAVQADRRAFERRRVEVVGLPLRQPQADARAATQAKIDAAALPAPGAGPPVADLAAARAHVFTRHPYTGRAGDHGVDDPLADDPAKLRDQHKDAAFKKRLAARQQTEDGRAVFREDGRHAAVLWAQRMVDIEAHALERGIELNPARRRPTAERDRGGLGD